MKAAFDS